MLAKPRPKRAVFVGQPRDLTAGKLRHQHRDFERQGPQPHGVQVGRDVERFCGGIAELQQVERGEIAGGVVEEHVFRARIAGADRAGRRAGVPVVDRRVILQAGVGGGPGGVADAVPQLARLQGLGDLMVGAARQGPVGVLLDRREELVGHPHRIVGVLARHGQIGFRIPVGVVGVEVDLAETLLGELDHALDQAVRHFVAPRRLHFALQRGILLGFEAIVARPLAIDAGLEHRPSGAS